MAEKSPDRVLIEQNEALARDNLELLNDIRNLEQIAMGMHELIGKIKDKIGLPAEADEDEVMTRLDFICKESGYVV